MVKEEFVENVIEKLRAAGQWMEGPQLPNRVVWYAWKLLISAAIIGLISIFYFNASKLTAHRQSDLSIPLDHAIPFVPWHFWIYFIGYIAGIEFSVFAFRNTRVFYKTSLAIIIATTLCTVGFFILPSTFPRPLDSGGGLTGEALRWFWVLDPPNNTFPSMHVSIMTICALGMWSDDNNRLKWISTLFWLGVVITVHTFKQHFIVDAVAGVGVGVMCYWIVFHWWPKRRSAKAAQPAEERFGDAARI